LIERSAVRALLLSPEEELLMMKITEPGSGRAFWLTPGGGMDAGESLLTSLRREILEETGLADFEIGPEVWHREHRFTWDGRAILQRERFYLVKVERFEPTAIYMPDDVERDAFGGFRWWPVWEIEQSSQSFAPRRLGRHLRSLIRHGPPARPLTLTD
jgi:8-oxo-dGTP pyrophosphatase MutT (NUDIX family)